MPITFTRSYQASDGKCYPTIEEAQAVEIMAILGKDDPGSTIAKAYSELVVENKDAILNILTTTEKSRPLARKANGATRKPRTPKAKPAEPSDTLPGV